MSVGEIVFILCFLFCAFVLCCTAFLRAVGFTFWQGLWITLAFVTFGIWNPVGWVVLVSCVVIRRKQVQLAMLESQARWTVLEQPSSGLRASAQAGSPVAGEIAR